jgi:hypothetical protein
MGRAARRPGSPISFAAAMDCRVGVIAFHAFPHSCRRNESTEMPDT